MRSITKKAGILAAIPVLIFTAVIAVAYAMPIAQGSIQPRDPFNPQLPETCMIECRMMTDGPINPNPNPNPTPGGPFVTHVRGTAVTQNITFSGADDPIVSTTEELISLVATGNDPNFGQITTTLERSRQVTPTTITANQLSEQFPATGRINFHVTIELGSQPGIVYRSMQEIQIIDPNLQTLRPHVNANYVMQQPVAFEDTRFPGEVAFRLQQLNVTIN